ncbi:MAG: class I SAM-dependent methyltransferase [Chloroflexota bacterium]
MSQQRGYDNDGAWWQAVRFGFRLLYHEMAFTYDTVSYLVSLGQWRAWQRTALQFLPDPTTGTVLEIAHGTGNLQLDLHAAGYNTVAFDYSAEMGHIARRKTARQGITPPFVRGMAQQLPFADNSVAAIVTTFPTNFIIQPETLTEAHRVLQSDGRLIAVLNGTLTGSGVVTGFIEWLYKITGQRDEGYAITDYFGGYNYTSVEAHSVDCDGSQAQLIVLTK